MTETYEIKRDRLWKSISIIRYEEDVEEDDDDDDEDDRYVSYYPMVNGVGILLDNSEWCMSIDEDGDYINIEETIDNHICKNISE